MPEWVSFVAPAVATVIVALIGVWTVRINKQRDPAEDIKVFTEAATLLIEPQRDRIAEQDEQIRAQDRRIADLAAQVRNLGREIKVLHRWALALQGQLLEAKIDPISFDEIQRLEPLD